MREIEFSNSIKYNSEQSARLNLPEKFIVDIRS